MLPIALPGKRLRASFLQHWPASGGAWAALSPALGGRRNSRRFAQSRAGRTQEESMTNLEIYLIANALTKLVTAVERLIWAIRRP